MNNVTASQHFLTATLDGLSFTPPQVHPGIEYRQIATGVLQIQPADTDGDTLPHILLSAGIHGNETAPIEILDQIISDIFSGVLPLQARVLVMFGNIDAMRIGKRFCDYDMNRLFNGSHQQQAGSREAARAAELEQLAANFFAQAGKMALRLHHDLHTAIRGSVFEQFAIYPYPDERPHDRQQLGWLADAGIATVLLHSKPAATFSYYTSHHCQAHAFTLELGKARPFGQNELARFESINQALRQLLQHGLRSDIHWQPARSQLFRAKYDLVRSSEDFRLHLADDVENFTQLPDGMILAEDGDKQIFAEGGDERILFPNPKVGLGLRAGIVIEPCQLENELPTAKQGKSCG